MHNSLVLHQGRLAAVGLDTKGKGVERKLRGLFFPFSFLSCPPKTKPIFMAGSDVWVGKLRESFTSTCGPTFTLISGWEEEKAHQPRKGWASHGNFTGWTMVLAATVAYVSMWLWQTRKAAARPQASYWTSQCLCLLILYFFYNIAKGILHNKRSPKSSTVAWKPVELCGRQERTKALEAGKFGFWSHRSTPSLCVLVGSLNLSQPQSPSV